MEKVDRNPVKIEDTIRFEKVFVRKQGKFVRIGLFMKKQAKLNAESGIIYKYANVVKLKAKSLYFCGIPCKNTGFSV